MTVHDETHAQPTPVRRQRVSGPFLWFGVLGGTVAWIAHELVSWSVTEIGCMQNSPGLFLQHGGVLGSRASAVVYAFIVGPWLVALASLIGCLMIRARLRRYGEDVLTRGRTHLLVVIGLFLNSMMLAIITGGGVAMLVLEPCT